MLPGKISSRVLRRVGVGRILFSLPLGTIFMPYPKAVNHVIGYVFPGLKVSRHTLAIGTKFQYRRVLLPKLAATYLNTQPPSIKTPFRHRRHDGHRNHRARLRRQQEAW